MGIGSDRPPVAPSLRYLASKNLDEMESAIAGVSLEVDRLSAGDAVAEFVGLQLGDIVVTAGDYGVPVHTRGSVPEDVVLLAVPLADGGGQWNGYGFERGLAWVYGPGSEHEGVGLGSSAFAAFVVPRHTLDDLGAHGASVPDVDGRVLLVRDAEVLRLRRAALELFVLRRRGLVQPDQALPLARDLLTRVAEVVAGGQPAVPMKAPAARRIVDACLDASTWTGPRPTPHELAEATGVTDRRVRAAFNEVFGVPPTTYFRWRALHGAHRALRGATWHEASVTDVAMRWGFWHLGRFSAEYRGFFGESPGRTLRRDGSASGQRPRLSSSTLVGDLL